MLTGKWDDPEVTMWSYEFHSIRYILSTFYSCHIDVCEDIASDLCQTQNLDGLSNSWMPFLESLSKTHFIHDLPFLQWVISAFSLQCYNLLSALLVRQVVAKHNQILPLTPSHLLYNLRSTTFNLKASQRVRFAVCSNSFCIRLIYFVKWVT